MAEITRSAFSLYKRNVGNKIVWYARFWDDELESYGSALSTGQTTKAAASRTAQKWLVDGMPQKKSKSGETSRNRILLGIGKYLRENNLVMEGEQLEPPRAMRLFYQAVTSESLTSEETFVGYLLYFWDWDSSYVQGRLDRGRSISKGYVHDCKRMVEIHIEPYFKDTLLFDVTPKMLEDFMQSIPRRENAIAKSDVLEGAEVKRYYSRRTINIILKTIKVALKDAERLEIIQKNPATKIELLAEDTRFRGILTPQELSSLFTQKWADKRSYTASLLAAVSGMRLGEIIALQITNLDFERNLIHVKHSYSAKDKIIKGTKTGKERLIYSDERILMELKALHDENPFDSDYIFWGLEADRPMRPDTVEHYFEKTLNALLGEAERKERNITFHSFRHFFNSTIRGAVSDETLRLQTGHSSEKMTDLYDHMTDDRGEQLRDAVRLKILPFVPSSGF